MAGARNHGATFADLPHVYNDFKNSNKNKNKKPTTKPRNVFFPPNALTNKKTHEIGVVAYGLVRGLWGLQGRKKQEPASGGRRGAEQGRPSPRLWQRRARHGRPTARTWGERPQEKGSFAGLVGRVGVAWFRGSPDRPGQSC